MWQANLHNPCEDAEPAQQVVRPEASRPCLSEVMGGNGGFGNGQAMAGMVFNHMWANFLEQGKALLQGNSGNARGDVNLQFNQNFGKQGNLATGGAQHVSNALPVAGGDTAALPVPALGDKDEPKDEKEGNEDQVGTSGSKSNKTLEDFERSNFKALQERKMQRTAMQKENKEKKKENNETKGAKETKVLKRPASAMSSRSCKASASAPRLSTLQLGCRKCRGGKFGCGQCRDPAYKGQRLTRAEWLEVAKKEGLK